MDSKQIKKAIKVLIWATVIAIAAAILIPILT